MGTLHESTRTADSKGRLTLGASFANRTVIVAEGEAGELIIRPARVIPEREAWLYENPDALASVRRGLRQAKAREYVKGPNLKAARVLADRLDDE